MDTQPHFGVPAAVEVFDGSLEAAFLERGERFHCDSGGHQRPRRGARQPAVQRHDGRWGLQAHSALRDESLDDVEAVELGPSLRDPGQIPSRGSARSARRPNSARFLELSRNLTERWR